jgi:hypothetical protein
VLWVCRASAGSAILALALFAVAPPARDLFAELASGPLYWAIFLLLVFGWALIVHYSARKALEQQAWAAPGLRLPLRAREREELQDRFAVSGTWVPRLLGLLCFAAVALGIHGAKETSERLGGQAKADAPGLDELLIATAAVAALYLVYVIIRRVGTIPLSVSLKGDPNAIAAEQNPFWFVSPAALRRRRDVRQGRVRADLIAFALVGVTLLCFMAAAVFPVALSYFVPRAWFVPVMLALPLFAVSYLTALSHYIRFPVLILAALVLGWLAVLAPHFHDARVATRAAGAVARQISLDDALGQWRRQACEAEPGDNCGRRPIILALAGGASRASFFSATVVGNLIDLTREADGGRRDFAHHVFAISGVSGGSVGAAMIRAALEDASPTGQPPCESSDGLWFGAAKNPGWNRFFGQTGKPETWKGCLQTLTSGDFLSPAILGLAFRDGFAGPITFAREHFSSVIDGVDRGALLELAFEGRYATVLAKPTNAWERFKSLLAREARAEHKALGRPFGRPAANDRWAPVLLLNATSVDTGRRVVASELLPTYGNGTRLFPEAYDMFVELGRTFHREGSELKDDCQIKLIDIPLSTAAALSARFPIVSPYGALRNPDASEAADRVVDGGYFENDGVTTAFELARAMVDREMRPIIIHITNDPIGRYDTRNPEGNAIDYARAPDLPKPRMSAFFESVFDPLTALFGTRGGHAAEAVRSILLAKEHMDYVRFQVFDQRPVDDPQPCDLRNGRKSNPGTRIDSVSMSWWLSGAVQEYLDRQLCQSDNANEYTRLQSLLNSKLK